MVLVRSLSVFSGNDFHKMLKEGLANKRTTMFFILQVMMALIFAVLYYCSVIFDQKVFGTKLEKDDMQANIFEALHFSLITQTTVGYSGGYTYLSESGKVVNFLHLFSMLAVLILV
uniref:Potassium channel domain-containing protein n=1 Tax=viral metagenome TaxID=1070528 RepID=A0A6C0CSY6_9ZZZZ